MRKGLFYSKLALGNLWRNRQTYFPYLLACTVSIFTFYTLFAINMNGSLDGVTGEEIVKAFTAMGSFILAIFCTILIFYTNSFLIKRRKKELGLYAILGMEKKNIGTLMFFETLFVAIIALGLGLLSGILLSRILFWVLLRMVRFPVMLTMSISGSAMAFTSVLFGFIFLLTLFSNLRQVWRSNPINLMAGDRQGEREPRASGFLAVLGILCLVGGYGIALHFTNPIEAILLFFVAAALVIAGTYCLFTSGSVALLKLLRKNKKFYYQPRHFVSISGMIYRMKQNATGLATICILSCMVLVTVAGTVSLNLGGEDTVCSLYPYNYEIVLENPSDGEALLSGAAQAATDNGVQFANLQDYEVAYFMAQEKENGFEAGADGNMQSLDQFSLWTLEDYNRNEGKQVRLSPDEILLFVTGGRYDSDTITIAGHTYHVTQIEQLGKEQSGSRAMGRTLTLIMADKADCETLLTSAGSSGLFSRVIRFDLTGNEAAIEQFDSDYNRYVNELSTQDYFMFNLQKEIREEWLAGNGAFLFLGIYFGILFVLAAAMIIYYKQVSEGYDDADRFAILQKVGMGEAEVKKTINSQVLTVFFAPLVVAVIHIAVALVPLSNGMLVFGLRNPLLLIGCAGGTVLIYALFYLLVYRATARTYFRIVRRHVV